MGNDHQPLSFAWIQTSVGDHLVWTRRWTGCQDPTLESMLNVKMMLTKTPKALNPSMCFFLLKTNIDNSSHHLLSTYCVPKGIIEGFTKISFLLFTATFSSIIST